MQVYSHDAAHTVVEPYHLNTLYLLSALCLILMTLSLGTQPLYLRSELGISAARAGAINANIMVVGETLELIVAGLVGYLSDRLGRKRIMVQGFLLAAVGASVAPFSAVLAGWFGVGGLTIYYMARMLMAVGIGAVWPQLWAIGGDYSDHGSRARLMGNSAFMMALGKTLVYAVLMQIPPKGGIVLTMLLVAVAAFAGAKLAESRMIDAGVKLQQPSVPWGRIRRLLADNPRLRLSFAAGFLARSDMVITALFLMLWCVYFAERAGVTREAAAAHGGMLIGLAGLVVMVSIPLWKIAIERFGRVAAIAASVALSGVGFVMIGFVANPFESFIMLPVAIAALGQAGCFLTPSILAVDVTPPDIRGSVLGAFAVVGGVGQVFFIQSGGILYDVVGPAGPFVFIGLANLIVTAYAVSMMDLGAEVRPS
ncbi:MAG: magnetosome biogenesis transporter MamH [Acidobacteriota bacterium]